MKFIMKGELRNDDHEKMRKGMEAFGKHGSAPGTEALWVSADGRTVFVLGEASDAAEVQKYNALYAPYFKRLEIHVVTDVETFTVSLQAVFDMLDR